MDGNETMRSLIEKFKAFGKKEEIKQPLEEMKVSRKRYNKEELSLIKSLIEQGLSNKEIALRLRRSEAGVRNLRYRIGLVKKAEDEVEALFKRRDELRSEVEGLSEQREALIKDLSKLNDEKDKLESIINADKIQLQNTIANILSTLKVMRPDLFILSPKEQAIVLLGLICKALSTSKLFSGLSKFKHI